MIKTISLSPHTSHIPKSMKKMSNISFCIYICTWTDSFVESFAFNRIFFFKIVVFPSVYPQVITSLQICHLQFLSSQCTMITFHFFFYIHLLFQSKYFWRILYASNFLAFCPTFITHFEMFVASSLTTNTTERCKMNWNCQKVLKFFGKIWNILFNHMWDFWKLYLLFSCFVATFRYLWEIAKVWEQRFLAFCISFHHLVRCDKLGF